LSENLDLVRWLYADWERGDFSAAATWADANIEFVVGDGPDPGTHSGLAAGREAFRTLLTPWTGAHAELEECRELEGGERVLALATFVLRGKSSGLDVRTKAATLFEFRRGKVIKLAVYADRHRALADLGLEG
jgi:ketosteroid isomerase-like protein